MKISSSDALAVLRAFDIAGEDAVPRNIERLVALQPLPTNALVHFRFGMQQYAILVDQDAADNIDYVYKQVETVMPGVEHELIPNPRDSQLTYGYPYKGKDLYLIKLGSATERLDVYLARNHPEISRSSWQKYIKQGAVSINGKTVTTPKQAVDSSSKIKYKLPEAPDHSSLELPILYIDDDVIVLNKPAGVLTHRKNQLDTEFTVADMVERHATEDIAGDRSGVVHRLDRDTSGVIIAARTQAAYNVLKSQFADRNVKKEYVAIIDGHLPSEKLNVDIPIARNSSRPGTFKADPDGKDAQTLASVVEQGSKLTLVKLSPRTGRTHQLRVHMAHLGTPIHGDRLYGSRSADRLYLHAHKLTLTLPNGDKKTFSSPLPKSFDITKLESGK